VKTLRMWATTLAVAVGLVPLACGGGGDGGGGTTACGTDDAGNHDLAHAAALGIGDTTTGCVAPNGRPDVYRFQLEDGGQSGYLTFQLTGDALGSPKASLYGADGDAALATVAAGDGGTPMAFVVAISPGVAYRLAIADEAAGAGPYTYNLDATFTPVPDAFEPNDRPEEAAPIVVGTPVEAYLFAGASADLAAYDDNYRVPLAAGQAVTVHLDDVPADIAPRIFLYDPSGAELGRVVNGHKGAPFTLTLPTVPANGDYTARVTLWTEEPATMSAAGAVPDHFTRPYHLTVTQP
jgi:hypothetical protein